MGSPLRSGASTVGGRMSKFASGKLFVLIITNFVDMVGVLMIIPLMPFYAREMGGGALVVVILMGAFTAAQLLSAPFWGRFSDRYGRRPALLVGLTASCIAYVVFAFAGSIWLLLLSRIVQGAGGGIDRQSRRKSRGVECEPVRGGDGVSER